MSETDKDWWVCPRCKRTNQVKYKHCMVCGTSEHGDVFELPSKLSLKKVEEPSRSGSKSLIFCVLGLLLMGGIYYGAMHFVVNFLTPEEVVDTQPAPVLPNKRPNYVRRLSTRGQSVSADEVLNNGGLATKQVGHGFNLAKEPTKSQSMTLDSDRILLDKLNPQKVGYFWLKERYGTQLLNKRRSGRPLLHPANRKFEAVLYPTQIGKMAAYVSRDPGDGKRHPAIIWMNHQLPNVYPRMMENSSTGELSGAQFHQADIVMMYPSMRGGNCNPGYEELLFGEVDDVMDACKYLQSLPYVDPQRIYLAGARTGGSLALLTAAASNQFRAIFAIEPVAICGGAGPMNIYNDARPMERLLRTPKLFLNEIKAPAFLFEGELSRGASQLDQMKGLNQNPRVKMYRFPGGNSENYVKNLNRVIAQKIKADLYGHCNISFKSQGLIEVAKD